MSPAHHGRYVAYYRVSTDAGRRGLRHCRAAAGNRSVAVDTRGRQEIFTFISKGQDDLADVLAALHAGVGSGRVLELEG